MVRTIKRFVVYALEKILFVFFYISFNISVCIMDREARVDEKNRGGRPKRRKFQGNQHTSKEEEKVSISNKKLNGSSFSTNVDSDISYEFINFISVFSAIASFVVCKVCHESVLFQRVYHRGLGFQMKIICPKCEDKSIYSCPTTISNKDVTYEINNRIVFVMRYLGIGYSGLELFCGLMDLPVPIVRRTYDCLIKNLRNVAKSVCQLSLNRIVSQESSFF